MRATSLGVDWHETTARRGGDPGAGVLPGQLRLLAVHSASVTTFSARVSCERFDALMTQLRGEGVQ